MPKRPVKIHFRIPPYPSGRRLHWRQAIHSAATAACERARVVYAVDDRLEVVIRVYLGAGLLARSDVDNLAKDVLDALQGRAGGPKRIRRLKEIIPNDNQVFRLVIEKAAPPKQARGLGHVRVRRLSRRTF